MPITLTSQQCLKARRLLGWSVRHLAEISGVSTAVITRSETQSEIDGRKRTMLQATFEAARVQLVPDFSGGSVILEKGISIGAKPRQATQPDLIAETAQDGWGS